MSSRQSSEGYNPNVPFNLSYHKLSEAATYNPVELSHVNKRSTVKVFPMTGNQYSSDGQRVIRFSLPAIGFLDTLNSYMTFDFQAKSAAEPEYVGVVPENDTFADTDVLPLGRNKATKRHNGADVADSKIMFPNATARAVGDLPFGEGGAYPRHNPHPGARVVPPAGLAADTTAAKVFNLESCVMMGGHLCNSGAPFQRAKVLINGTTVEDIDGYNQLFIQLERYLQSADYGNSPAGRVNGTYLPEDGDWEMTRLWNTDYMGDPANNPYYFTRLPNRNPYKEVVSYTVNDSNYVARAGANIDGGNLQDYSDKASRWPPRNCSIQGLTDVHRGFEYVHQLKLGLMRLNRYLPLGYLGEVVIELHLGDANQVLYAPVADDIAGRNTPKYNLTNPVLHLEVLEFNAVYSQGFEKALNERSVYIPYSTFSHFTHYGAGGSAADLHISFRGRNVKSLITTIRGGQGWSKYNSETFITGRGGLTEYQVKIGPYQKPLDPIKVSPRRCGQAWAELAKTLYFLGDVTHDPMFNSNAWPEKQFMIGLDLERESGLYSGLDTASDATPILMHLESESVNAGLNANTSLTFDTWVHSQNVLILNGAREVSVEA